MFSLPSDAAKKYAAIVSGTAAVSHRVEIRAGIYSFMRVLPDGTTPASVSSCQECGEYAVTDRREVVAIAELILWSHRHRVCSSERRSNGPRSTY